MKAKLKFRRGQKGDYIARFAHKDFFEGQSVIVIDKGERNEDTWYNCILEPFKKGRGYSVLLATELKTKLDIIEEEKKVEVKDEEKTVAVYRPEVNNLIPNMLDIFSSYLKTTNIRHRGRLIKQVERHCKNVQKRYTKTLKKGLQW